MELVKYEDANDMDWLWVTCDDMQCKIIGKYTKRDQIGSHDGIALVQIRPHRSKEVT